MFLHFTFLPPDSKDERDVVLQGDDVLVPSVGEEVCLRLDDTSGSCKLHDLEVSLRVDTRRVEFRMERTKPEQVQPRVETHVYLYCFVVR